MTATESFDDVTVLVLAGGRGTRISAIHPTVPKPLIEVNGRPFLSWLTEIIADHGPRQFVFSAGHMADQITEWAASGEFPSLDRRVQPEISPLGTGGGLLNGLDRIKTPWILVVNGDGVCLGGLDELLALRRDEDVDGGLIGVKVEDASRYGSLGYDADRVLTEFREKAPGSGYINAGFYLFSRSVLESVVRAGACSLERDLIPEIIAAKHRLRVVLQEDARFIDIGTPASLAVADAFIREAIQAKNPGVQ